SAPEALQLCPLPSSHVDYYRPIGSRREEGWQARMRVSSRRLSTLPSSLLPSRLLPTNWIETKRGMAGKDESFPLTSSLPSSLSSSSSSSSMRSSDRLFFTRLSVVCRSIPSSHYNIDGTREGILYY
ncbi:hypothetical protein PRIPAC_87535, partial [Pristionchus pacificus]|uniref:Uncharacterized protein n=1 Tax=Pristionchus pacificus TaxID=54126 RepID=A0A2A6CZ66_PRIPA